MVVHVQYYIVRIRSTDMSLPTCTYSEFCDVLVYVPAAARLHTYTSGGAARRAAGRRPPPLCGPAPSGRAERFCVPFAGVQYRLIAPYVYALCVV